MDDEFCCYNEGRMGTLKLLRMVIRTERWRVLGHLVHGRLRVGRDYVEIRYSGGHVESKRAAS